MAANRRPRAPGRFRDARALRTLRRLLAALLPADDAGDEQAGATGPPGALRAARCALFAAWGPHAASCRPGCVHSTRMHNEAAWRT